MVYSDITIYKDRPVSSLEIKCLTLNSCKFVCKGNFIQDIIHISIDFDE